MGEPLRIDCASEAEIPPAEDLCELVTRDRHVVLQFQLGADGLSPIENKLGTISRLARELPDDFEVCGPGGPKGQIWITVTRVIPRDLVLEHEEAFVGAARAFRNVARQLVLQLAAKLKVDPARFWTTLIRTQVAQCGRLSGPWRYYFHGLQCTFKNERTGQVVDVELGYEDEFGVLDPYFFAAFLRTTRELQPLSRLLCNNFSDPKRILRILEERGRLRRVERFLCSGSGLAVVE